MSETFFRLKKIENVEFEELFHINQKSTENRNNLFSNKTKNGLCIWISSNSSINRQGSFMVYQINNEDVQTWYLSIEENKEWKITRTKGIGKKQIQMMLT